MKTLTYSLLAVMGLVGFAGFGAKTADAATGNSLRNEVVAWVISHTGKSPDTNFVKSLTKYIDDSLADGKNISLLFGSELTVSGKVEELWLFADQMYDVVYNAEDARILNIKDKVSCSRYPRHERTEDAQAFQLSDVQIDSGDPSDGTQPIKGSVHCKQLRGTTNKVAIRMTVHYGITTIESYKTISQGAPQNGTISFSFPPLNKPEDQDKVSGPIVVFFDIIEPSDDDNQPANLISNTKAALVTISDSTSPFGR